MIRIQKKFLTELNHDSMLYDHKRHLYNTTDDIQLYKVKEYHCGHLIPDKLLCH